MISRKPEHRAAVRQATPLFHKALPLFVELIAVGLWGDKRSRAVPAFEQALGGEFLVDAQHRVGVDRKPGGEPANRLDLFAGGEPAGEALRAELVGDLARDGRAGVSVDLEKHGAPDGRTDAAVK